MDNQQKLTALNILRNGGWIASEVGRKSAVLEILGHAELGLRLVNNKALQSGIAVEIKRLSANQPSFLDAPEGYKRPPALDKAEEDRQRYSLDWYKMRDEIGAIAETLEAELDAVDPAFIAKWQEGQVIS